MSVDLFEEARRRLEAGHPASARDLAGQALEAARAANASAAVARAAQLLGECLFGIGEVDAAGELAREALQIDEARGDATALGADLNLLGVVEVTNGRLEEGLSLFRRSLDLREEALGPDDEETIESLNNVGVAMWRLGAEDEALATHEEALRRCERSLGDTHRRTAETLNALAVKRASRPDDEARTRDLYERALAAAEAGVGADSDLVARLSVNVATALIDAGDLERAGPLAERGVALHEQHFGRGSRWTSYALVTLANLAWLQGRHADARTAFERSLIIRADELGPDHPETLEAATGLQATLADMAAEDPEARAEGIGLYLPIAALRGGDYDGPFVASALPSAEAAAEQLLAYVGRLRQRTAADPAQLYAIARAEGLGTAADASHLAGDLSKAHDLLEEQIVLLEAARGTSDPALVEPLRRLSVVHRVGGTESAALGILQRIARILTDAYGELHPLTIRAWGDLYLQERREFGPAGGRATAERIIGLSRAALGENNPISRVIDDAFQGAREALPPGMEPDPEPLSIRRERALAAPSALADELLADLGSTPWLELHHAYARAVDTPRHLRLLVEEDDRVRNDALDLLGDSLLDENAVYPATTPAVIHVRRLVVDSRVPGRGRLVAFLAAAWVAAGNAGGDGAEELRHAMTGFPELLSRLASDEDAAVREAATFALTMVDPRSE